MANLLSRAIGAPRGPERGISTLEDYVKALNAFQFGGHTYPLGGVQTTQSGEAAEPIANSLEAYARQAYASNGIVFAVMLVRQMVFSAVRFQYQRFHNGRPAALWGDRSLQMLETPWPGGTTQDLLSRMIQDADLAGAFIGFKDTPLSRLGGDDQGEIVRLRPDWVQSVLQRRVLRGAQVGWRKVGYTYWEGGVHSGVDPVPFLSDEITYFAPIPDPLAPFRGMSWLTPVLREIQADGLMNRHKQKFFENAATPNVIVRMDPAIQLEAFEKFRATMDAHHRGVEDAYKTLYVGAAADVTVAGANFQQMDFKQVQGGGETRIAAAGGVPPVIVGLSEGLQGSSLNAGNYGQSRRRLADGTMHPLWGNVAGSLAPLVKAPSDSRLWYDARDVPFLREDSGDAANIAQTRASTLRTYIDAGFTPESAVAALDAGDEGLLVHSGLYSVQLQKPGTNEAPAPTAPSGEDTAP